MGTLQSLTRQIAVRALEQAALASSPPAPVWRARFIGTALYGLAAATGLVTFVALLAALFLYLNDRGVSLWLSMLLTSGAALAVTLVPLVMAMRQFRELKELDEQQRAAVQDPFDRLGDAVGYAVGEFLEGLLEPAPVRDELSAGDRAHIRSVMSKTG